MCVGCYALPVSDRLARVCALSPPADAGRSSSGVRGDGLTTRFYRTVNVAPAPQARATTAYMRVAARRLTRRACTAQGDGTYIVLLDGRTLRTPARNALSLPSLPLALAVAAEWEWQEQRNLRPFTMPIMVRSLSLLRARLVALS